MSPVRQLKQWDRTACRLKRRGRLGEPVRRRRRGRSRRACGPKAASGSSALLAARTLEQKFSAVYLARGERRAGGFDQGFRGDFRAWRLLRLLQSRVTAMARRGAINISADSFVLMTAYIQQRAGLQHL